MPSDINSLFNLVDIIPYQSINTSVSCYSSPTICRQANMMTINQDKMFQKPGTIEESVLACVSCMCNALTRTSSLAFLQNLLSQYPKVFDNPLLFRETVKLLQMYEFKLNDKRFVLFTLFNQVILRSNDGSMDLFDDSLDLPLFSFKNSTKWRYNKSQNPIQSNSNSLKMSTTEILFDDEKTQIQTPVKISSPNQKHSLEVTKLSNQQMTQSLQIAQSQLTSLQHLFMRVNKTRTRNYSTHARYEPESKRYQKNQIYLMKGVGLHENKQPEQQLNKIAVTEPEQFFDKIPMYHDAHGINNIRESHHMRNDIYNNDLFHSFILTVYFSEYLNEKPIKLEISEPWTVNETIIKSIENWNIERSANKLKSNLPSNYLMRGIEMDMDEIEIDTDIPPYAKRLKINTLNEKYVGLQYIENDPRKYSGFDNQVMEFKNAKEQIFVRVSIPGPNNETHVLAIDGDASALTLRDLISLLNKKKHGAHFHPQYFHFYFDDNDGMGRIIDLNNNINSKRKILSLAKCIIDLKEPRQLFLLPKFLGSNDDLNEAYNFNLVRLANETREYRCTKIRNARKNKKRLLIVNRHRIVKKAMDDYNIGTSDHVPIDIISIINLQIVDKDNKQFSIEYRKPQAGGIRQQIYEFDTEKECKHFVDKVKYLKTIRQLQGI
eukprot:191386_1